LKTESIYEISEAASVCNLNSDIIMEFIKYEWINPADPKKLLLDKEDISRIQLISELTTNLGVNDESVPIILHLIDQLHYLHHVGR
jgi:chaperone modulatory protein CbpM